MGVPISKSHRSRRSWLVGIPKKNLPDLWWRLIFWPTALAKNRVPARSRSAGMYCPRCGKGQPFFDRCLFCGCVFSCFFMVETNADSMSAPQSKASISVGVSRQDLAKRILTWFHSVSLRTRMILIGVLFLVLLILVAGVVRQRMHVRSQYARNFVLALYGIRSGMNLGEMICDGTYNAWRGIESTSNEMDPQALADLEAVKTDTRKNIEEMGKPPAEYDQAARILRKLYINYEKTNTMIMNSPNNPSRLKPEIVASGEEFSREIKLLKANMPAQLVEEVGKSSQKYDLIFLESDK